MNVGLADDLLASFVVACSSVFSPKKTGNKNYELFCFLAEQMCDLSARSRIYSSYGVIEPAAIKFELPEVVDDDITIVEAIMQCRRRCEFLVQTPVPSHKMLFDLPNFATTFTPESVWRC